MTLQWEHEPVLHDPVVVAAFTGWNDAADAASDAVAWLAARYGATPFASIDEQVHVDFQAQRPTVELVDGAVRELRWPRYTLRAAATPDGEPDLVLVSGPEPNYGWRTFCTSVMEAARGVGADTVVTFGALLADTPHTRTPRISGSATDPAAMTRIGMSRSRYEGPTGMVGVLHDSCRTAGFASASLWVPVPHYLASPPNPPAIVALLEAFGDCVTMDVDVRELTVAARAWQARVDAAVATDSDLREYVETLETQHDTDEDASDDLPDGDQIAAAFEEFLRDQRGD
jgi:hypothetical protein